MGNLLLFVLVEVVGVIEGGLVVDGFVCSAVGSAVGGWVGGGSFDVLGVGTKVEFLETLKEVPCEL